MLHITFQLVTRASNLHSVCVVIVMDFNPALLCLECLKRKGRGDKVQPKCGWELTLFLCVLAPGPFIDTQGESHV